MVRQRFMYQRLKSAALSDEQKEALWYMYIYMNTLNPVKMYFSKFKYIIGNWNRWYKI